MNSPIARGISYIVAATAIGLIYPCPSTAQPASEPLRHFWRTDGPVNTVLVHSNRVYLGGQFTYVGPWTGGAGLLNTNTAAAVRGFPEVSGSLMAALPDGSGGWFIGGSFTNVGGIVRSNLAHIRADLSVDPIWGPPLNGAVNAMVLTNDILYVGGTFTRVGTVTRNRLAAFDLATGAITTWNPNAQSTVSAMLLLGQNVYLGGGFTSMGGQSRARLAAVDVDTGQVQAWNPGASGSGAGVSALTEANNVIYAGGTFTTAGTKPRNRIVALSPSSDVALDWNPNANGAVRALVAVGNLIYAAGDFTSIGGATRNRLAAVDDTLFQATPWDPNVDGGVNSMTLAGGDAWIAGSFTTVGGQVRQALAAVDLGSGAATHWAPTASGLLQGAAPTASLIAVSGEDALIGTTFTSLGGVQRTNVAALDLINGEATEWNPGANAPVNSIAASGNNIYIGGGFTNVGGQMRRRLAEVDAATGEVTEWDPNVLGRNTVNIYSLIVDASRLYVGGNFTNIAGTQRHSLAAFDLPSGSLNTWNPAALATSLSASASVNALLVHNDVIYAGGDFMTNGGKPRSRIAALNSTTGAATDWNPGAQNTVLALAALDTNIFAGGTFTSLGTQTRGRIGAIDTETGTVTPWNPDAGVTSPLVRALTVGGRSLYAGGQFTRIGGEFRNRLAGINPINGLSHSWNPDLNGLVRNIAFGPGLAFVGGDFTTIGGRSPAYFAALSTAPAFDSVEILPDGGLAGLLRTGEGQRVLAQYSTNMVDWVNILTNTPSGAQIPVQAVGDPGYRTMFLRAVVEQ